jgi:UDPglucose--hexose-1-phosphate uridylyltransferase
MAPARAQRPHQFHSRPSYPLPHYEATCPFCPGQEAQTPPPIAVVPANDASAPWLLRVVPNKFPALEARHSASPGHSSRLFPALAGTGYHEVIIDTPDHAGHLPNLPPSQVALLLRIWRERFQALQQDPQVQVISLFKNHGERAGASLLHPHTQILALPVMSATVQGRHTLAQQYYTARQRCLYCDVLSAECADGQRLVCSNAAYVVYQPYAARFPFETWIMPRQHQACFAQATGAALAMLVPMLQGLLQRLDTLLSAYDYNLMVHSAVRQEASDSYHWFFQLIPRLVGMAGFELGTGMALNSTLPETAAAWLRRATNP